MRLPVTLLLKPSRRLAVAQILAHALAVLGLVATPQDPGFKLVAVVVLAASLVFALRRHVMRRRLRALTLRADGQVEALEPDGTATPWQVDGRSTVFPWLVVLLLRGEGRRLALTLPADALEAGDHRRLRLWLRWKAASSTSATTA